MFKQKYDLFVLLVSCGFIILAVLAPIIFTMETTTERWNFKETGPIGDTIGGTAGPILSLLASVLVYFSFREQFQANQRIVEQQAYDKNYQIVSKLLEQFKEETEKEIDLIDMREMFVRRMESIFHSEAEGDPTLRDLGQDKGMIRDEDGNPDIGAAIRGARDSLMTSLQTGSKDFSQLYFIVKIAGLIIDRLNKMEFNQEEKGLLEITFLIYFERFNLGNQFINLRGALPLHTKEPQPGEYSQHGEYLYEVILKSDFWVKYDKLYSYYHLKRSHLE